MSLTGQSNFRVIARSAREREPTARMNGRSEDCHREANRLAEASGDEGVMSVWVECDDGTVIWAAGEKAQELTQGGLTVDRFGEVRR